MATLLQDAAFVGAAIVFAAMVARPRPWHFGLRSTRIATAVGYVIAGYLVFLASAATWSPLPNLHEPYDAVEQPGAYHPTHAIGSVALLPCVVAPGPAGLAVTCPAHAPPHRPLNHGGARRCRPRSRAGPAGAAADARADARGRADDGRRRPCRQVRHHADRQALARARRRRAL